MRIFAVTYFFLLFFNGQAQETKPLNYKNYHFIYEIEEVKPDPSIYLEDNPNISDLIIEDSLQLIVLPGTLEEFPKKNPYRIHNIEYGFQLYLINDTDERISLASLVNRVAILRQVFYKEEWRNLAAYFRPSIGVCGNNLVKYRCIEANSYIPFVAPYLEGNLSLKMRFVAVAKNREPFNLIISNEFEGLVHTALIQMEEFDN